MEQLYHATYMWALMHLKFRVPNIGYCGTILIFLGSHFNGTIAHLDRRSILIFFTAFPSLNPKCIIQYSMVDIFQREQPHITCHVCVKH